MSNSRVASLTSLTLIRKFLEPSPSAISGKKFKNIACLRANPYAPIYRRRIISVDDCDALGCSVNKQTCLTLGLTKHLVAHIVIFLRLKPSVQMLLFFQVYNYHYWICEREQCDKHVLHAKKIN